VANIAGSKVDLDEVSRMAELEAGVLRAVALAESNSVTGEIVVLHFALKPGTNVGDARMALEEALRAQLPKAAWPRRWVHADVAPCINAKRRIC
jgi:acyl-CoA synthetase (AMP-forming)/AMP-acid ligase II